MRPKALAAHQPETELLRGDPRARVADVEPDAAAVCHAVHRARHLDAARHAVARVGELDHTAEQVEHDLPQLLPVGPRAQPPRRARPRVAEPLGAEPRRYEHLRLGYGLRHRHVREPVRDRARLDARVVEPPGDEPEQVPLAPLDACERHPLRVGDRPVDAEFDRLREAADGVEGRAQLVRRHGACRSTALVPRHRAGKLVRRIRLKVGSERTSPRPDRRCRSAVQPGVADVRPRGGATRNTRKE